MDCLDTIPYPCSGCSQIHICKRCIHVHHKKTHICSNCGKISHECDICGYFSKCKKELEKHQKESKICKKARFLTASSLHDQLKKAGLKCTL